MSNGFRVWSITEEKMYYDGFVLRAEGELLRILECVENINNEYEARFVGVNPLNYVVMMKLEGRKDISGDVVYEKDILRYETGFEYCIEFGTHDAFCPGDKMWGSNEGYVAALYDPITGSNHQEVYPLMDIESLALRVGNLYEGYSTEVDEND